MLVLMNTFAFYSILKTKWWLGPVIASLVVTVNLFYIYLFAVIVIYSSWINGGLETTHTETIIWFKLS